MRTLKVFIIFSLLAFTVQAQKLANTKYVNFTSTSYAINLSSNVDVYEFGGSKTLGAAYSITVTGTPVNGMRFLILYNGISVTTSGFNVIVMGDTLWGTVAVTTLQTMFATSKYIFDCIHNGTTAAWDVRCTPDINVKHWIQPGHLSKNWTNDTTLYVNSDYKASIKPLSLTNSLISTSAAIGRSKLAALTAGKVVVTDITGHDSASSVTKTSLSFLDATSSIQTQINTKPTIGAIINTDINASAAIAYSKLSLTNGIVSSDINSAAAIPYSKLLLTGTVVNADVASGAAIARNKLAALTASKAVVTDASGFDAVSTVTATELGYLAGVTSNIQTQLTAAAAGVSTYTTIATNTYLLPATIKSQTWINTTSGAVDVYIPRPDSVGPGATITFTVWFTNGATIHTYAAYSGIKTSAASVGTTYAIGSTNGDFVTLISDGVYWIVSKFRNL